MLARTLQDMFKRYRRPGDIVFALTFFGFSIFLLTQIGSQTTVAEGKAWFAQSNLWPKISIWVMCVFAGLHLLGSALSPRIPGRLLELWFWIRSLEYVAYFLVYVLIVPWLGYLPATVVFCVFLTLRAGFRSLAWCLCAIATAIFVVVIFKSLLQVKIPAGALYEYLPQAIRSFALTYL